MREALKEAEEAYAAREVPVGVVVVSNNRIISRANNQVDPLQDATAHVEMLAGCTVFTISCCGLLVCVYITFLPLVGMC